MRERGYTLIEMILVIVLMGLVAGVSVSVLMGGFGAFFQQRQTAEIERQAMLALERIGREVRLGTNFVVAGNTLTFDRGGTLTVIGHDPLTSELFLNQGGGNSTLAETVTGVSFSEETEEDARYFVVEFDVANSTHSWRTTIYPRNAQS